MSELCCSLFFSDDDFEEPNDDKNIDHINKKMYGIISDIKRKYFEKSNLYYQVNKLDEGNIFLCVCNIYGYVECSGDIKLTKMNICIEIIDKFNVFDDGVYIAEFII